MSRSKRFNLVLLGHPSSGKTAFLTMLASGCPEGVFPQEARQELLKHWDSLGRGEPLEATRTTTGAGGWVFHTKGTGSQELEVTTFDYAGELTKKLNEGFKRDGFQTPESKRLQNDIHNSDAVLFIVDSHALARSGGWNNWYDANAKELLSFIKTVVSDQRRHPLTILVTRSDLVEQGFLEKALTDASKTVHELGLNAQVTAFRSFTSKSGQPASIDLPDLPEDYLAPGDLPRANPPPEELVRKLWHLHSRTKPFKLTHVALVGLGLIFLGVALLAFFTAETPVAPNDVLDVVQNIPDDWNNEVKAKTIAGRLYVVALPGAPDADPPWARFAEHWLIREWPDDSTEDVKAARKLFAQKARVEVLRVIDGLSYQAKDGSWHPGSHYRWLGVYDRLLRRMEHAGALEGVSREIKKKLNKELAVVEGLNQESLIAMAREYIRLGEVVPDAIRKRLTDLVYFDCLDRVGAQIQRYIGADAEGYRKLYEEELPKILSEALGKGQELLSDDKRRELEDARKYLDRLRNTRKLEFRIKAFAQIEADSFQPSIRIKVGPLKVTARAWYYYPQNAVQTQNDEDYKKWPQGSEADKASIFDPITSVTIEWYYSAPIVIEAWNRRTWGRNQRLVVWNSQRINNVEKKGYDLPGLTFMIFWEAHEFFTNYETERNNLFYRLELEKKGNGYDMLHIPAFLVEANRRRGKR